MNVGERLGDLLALAAGILAASYGTYLVVIGPDAPFITEAGVVGTARLPTMAGLLPIGIGLIAIWAVARHRTGGIWTAATLAAVLALVFLFSLSLQFAGLALLLFAAATVKTLATRIPRGSRDIHER